MMKFRNATWLFVVSVMLTASKVNGVMLKDHKLNIPKFFGENLGGQQGQLIYRTVQSKNPTQPPTMKNTAPTESPTESPAPSPSPSEVPTKDPERDTTSPTDAPTESPAPSPSPSEVPTSTPSQSPSDVPSVSPTVSAAPSSSPSDAPSAKPSASPSFSPSVAPTISSAPSSSPSASPSDTPSDAPSFAPSMNPTVSAQPSFKPSASPSDTPSVSPSASPTEMPSQFPSDAPSMSPTSVMDRTKTATVTLLLEEITGEMDRISTAEFELFTLDFLRKKLVPQDEYVLNTIAVTALSQKTVYNNITQADEIAEPLTRKLETENWSVGLEIDVRTVSVTTEGRVPQNFNYTEEVLYVFFNHWDQYLYQLGNSVEFFNPLVAVSDWDPIAIEDAVDGKKSKAGFVVAVLFSFVAFGLAIFASYIAIRKHMNKNQRTPYKKKMTRGILFSPKTSPEVINYLTKTMSDSPVNEYSNNYHDGDIEGGGATGLMRNINIDVNENGMESIALTPRANFKSPSASVRNGLFVVNEGSDDERSPVRSPMASSPMDDELKTRANTSRIGGQIKKWLTPRGMKAGYGSSRRLSSDPPENQSILGYNYGKEYIEPNAEKEATRSIKEATRSIKESTRSIKASTKNNAGVYTTDKSTVDGRSKATGISYNKDPANDDGNFTLPISFFSKRGPGTNVSGADSPMSSLADSNASSFFAIGNMNKSFAGNNGEEGYEVKQSNVASIMRPDQLTSDLLNQPNEPSEADENKPTPFVRSLSPSNSSAKSSAVRLAAKRFEEPKQEKPLREIQPPSSTVGVETILGARSRDSAEENEDKRSRVSSSFLKNRSMFSPNQKKEVGASANVSKKYGYGRVNIEVQEQRDARSVTSHSTLGARPMMTRNDDDDKSTVSAMSTLTSVRRKQGCYDVYAPSGPIGIVVDTSKNGPSVHSLKSTSPMLGLITPGDLIVALDGEDTRQMTAAALTRLMARKSRNKERKITLLS